MKRFLNKLVWFLLPLLGLAIGLEWIAESIPNSYTYKRTYIEQHGREIKTLILGSSYAYDGINAALIPQAFNLANSSQTIDVDYRLLDRYIPKMDSLKRVILPISYSTLGDYPEQQRRTYYTIYMDLYPRWPLSRHSFEIFYPELLIKKLIKYAVSHDITRCDRLGQRSEHTKTARNQGIEFWNKDIDAMVRNDVFDPESRHEMVAENIQYLYQLVDLCNHYQVQLIVVNMPVLPTYKNRLPSRQIQLTDQLLQDLATKVTCLDATSYNVPDDDWYNVTHLTKEGSVAFTQWLIDQLEKKYIFD